MGATRADDDWNCCLVTGVFFMSSEFKQNICHWGLQQHSSILMTLSLTILSSFPDNTNQTTNNNIFTPSRWKAKTSQSKKERDVRKCKKVNDYYSYRLQLCPFFLDAHLCLEETKNTSKSIFTANLNELIKKFKAKRFLDTFKIANVSALRYTIIGSALHYTIKLKSIRCNKIWNSTKPVHVNV